jgi:hypothetical protein
MRNLLIGLLLGLIIAGPAARTGQQAERIVVGAPVQIGMTKDAVISEIVERGFIAQKTRGGAEEAWLVFRKEDPDGNDPLGLLMFTDSHLFWASHTWASSGEAGNSEARKDLLFSIEVFRRPKQHVLSDRYGEAGKSDHG